MKKLLMLVALIFSMLNIACHKRVEEAKMPEKYNNFIQYCVGRNVIKIPDVFSASRVTSGYFRAFSNGEKIYPFDVNIDKKKLTQKDFSNHISTRAGELKSSGTASVDVLRAEKKLSGVATLFRVQQVDDAYQDELHFLLGENLIVVTLDSYRNTYLAAEDRLVKFMADFSLTDQDRTSGFCLGPVTVHGNFDQESGGSYFRDSAGNTYDIKIDTFAKDDPKRLRQRMSGPDSLLSMFHIGHTVLRSRDRTTAGMHAQEWLGWTNFGGENDGKTFKFVLETMRPKASKTTPSITITYDSAQKLADGTETKTNFSDDEAMAIWDKVIDSIQPVH